MPYNYNPFTRNQDYYSITGEQGPQGPQGPTGPAGGVVQNVITVGKSNGDFTSIEAALASITDNSATNRYSILVGPGVYDVNNNSGPIALKAFVGITAYTTRSVLFQPTTATNDMFTGANFAYIEGIVFTGNTDGWILNHTASGNVNINDCVLRDSGNGFLLNGASSVLEMRRIVVNNPAATTTSCAIQVSAGSFVFKDILARSTSRITTFIEISGANTIGSLTDITTNSTNVTTALKVYDGALVAGNSLTLNMPYDGILLYGNNTNLSLTSLQINMAGNDGFRIENIGTNLVARLFATTITECTNYNFNLLNASCIVTGNGYTEIDKMHVVPGAQIYAEVLDIKEDDEALHVLGELHVGTPNLPAESCFGGGDSYTTNILVYTFDGVSTYTDVTTEASSASASNFSFPGTSINNAIYVSTSLMKDEEYLSHPGIKASIETAAVLGTGNIIIEYWNGSIWTEINGMVTNGSQPFLSYAKDYFSDTGSFQIRYDTVKISNGTWTKNDPMSLGTDYYWIRYRISSPITTAPVFQQIKIHSHRSEFNSDGFLEYFGDSRPYVQLPISVGSGKPFEGNMQSQSIYMDENIGVGYIENRFTLSSDKYGWEIISPNNIDTSSNLSFRWCGRPSTTGSITWTVRWSWLQPDGTIYTTEPALGSNPNSKSTTTTKSVTSGTLEWFETNLDISDLIPRRDSNYPDLLMISIQPSTMSGTFDLIGVQAYYLTWCSGGHSD